MNRAARRAWGRTQKIRIIDKTRPTTTPLAARKAQRRRANEIAAASRKANR